MILGLRVPAAVKGRNCNCKSVTRTARAHLIRPRALDNSRLPVGERAHRFHDRGARRVQSHPLLRVQRVWKGGGGEEEKKAQRASEVSQCGTFHVDAV